MMTNVKRFELIDCERVDRENAMKVLSDLEATQADLVDTLANVLERGRGVLSDQERRDLEDLRADIMETRNLLDQNKDYLVARTRR